MAVAWRYGVGNEVDAYVFVYNIVNWPIAVLFGVLTTVIIPLLTGLKTRGSQEVAHFQRELIGITLLLAGLIGVAFWALVPSLLRSDWVGLPVEVAKSAIAIAPELSLLVPLGALISLGSVWLMALGRHRNTLFEAVPSATICLFLVVHSPKGLDALVLGTIVGFIFHLIFLALPLTKLKELRWPVLSLSSPAWKGVRTSIGVMLIAQLLMSLTSIIDQFFAAQLPTGSISSLSYANRILALILGMGAIAISRATLPIFSKMGYEYNSVILQRVALRWARLLFIIGLLGAAVAWYCMPMVVSFLFERGQFTARDTEQVTLVAQFYLIQVPVYFYSIVLVSVISSQKKYNVILIVGILALIVKIFMNFILVDKLGLIGIALATAVVYLVNSVFLTVKLRCN